MELLFSNEKSLSVDSFFKWNFIYISEKENWMRHWNATDTLVLSASYTRVLIVYVHFHARSAYKGAHTTKTNSYKQNLFYTYSFTRRTYLPIRIWNFSAHTLQRANFFLFCHKIYILDKHLARIYSWIDKCIKINILFSKWHINIKDSYIV